MGCNGRIHLGLLVDVWPSLDFNSVGLVPSRLKELMLLFLSNTAELCLDFVTEA